MNTLLELLDPECISLDLVSKKKNDSLKELVELLDKEGKVKDPALLLEELIERESLSSTGIGEGVALPHKLSSAMDRTVMACGVSKKGLNFDAVDKKRVHLVFLIAGPSTAAKENLVILSKLSRLLHDPGFRSRLLCSESPEKFIELFSHEET